MEQIKDNVCPFDGHKMYFRCGFEQHYTGCRTDLWIPEYASKLMMVRVHSRYTCPICNYERE